ncbi:MAG: 30S ribosomal protein S6 [Oscillospiraceae bacterium]|nr:30S ribosomal protein S6 [Oscillospiraceae bacterium]
MKQQFIGLQHCKCGMSWKKDIGFFERTPDMVFGLRHNAPGKKPRRMIEIRREN